MQTHIPLTVADIMTRTVITISEDETIENVERGMKQFRFRHLPVVRGKKLVGIITQRDMLRISASSFSSQRQTRDELIHRVPASRVMHEVVMTVNPDDPIELAGELMWELKIGCVCVTDDDDDLVGIVTESDFIVLAMELLRHPQHAPDLRPTRRPSPRPIARV